MKHPMRAVLVNDPRRYRLSPERGWQQVAKAVRELLGLASSEPDSVPPPIPIKARRKGA